MPRDAFVLKIQRVLCHPKCSRKVSGLSRNRPLGMFCVGFACVGETLCDVYANEHESHCVDACTALNPTRNIYLSLILKRSLPFWCLKGMLKDSNSRRDVDREFFLLFATFDENRSWYLNDNINRYCSNPGPLNQLKNDAGFKESNQNYAINGYLYGNLPGLKMYRGEKVAWYLIGFGDLTDIHTVHFHGQTFIYVRAAIKTDKHHQLRLRITRTFVVKPFPYFSVRVTVLYWT